MAKDVYIGVQTSHTYTNMLGGIGDMETGAVYKTTAEAAYLKNSSQHKFGSSSQAFQQSGSATELTYTLRNSAGQISFALDNTHTYYFSVWINQRTSLNITFDCYWPIAEPSIMSGVKNTALNTWEQHSAVFTRSSFTSGAYPMRIDCNNYPGNNAQMNVDGMMLIDLTATYGAGNEPAKEFCDQYFAFTTGTNTVTIPTAREITKMYIGVGGKARKVKKAYIGVGGKARLFYSSGLPQKIIDIWKGYNNFNKINCMTYDNGYYVVGGVYNNGSYTQARIAYTKDLLQTWTIKDLWQGLDDTSINCITYANGYWVVGGTYHASGSNQCGYINYTKDITAQTWEGVRVWESSSISEAGINAIVYSNGYWAVGGYNCNRRNKYMAYIAYSTDLSTGWNEKMLWSSSDDGPTRIYDITYANGYWVAAGIRFNTNADYTYDGRIAYTTDLTQSWTTKTIWADGLAGEVRSVVYADGYWAVCGSYGSNSSKTNHSIAYSTSPDGVWTIKNMWVGSTVGKIHRICYNNGKWVFGGNYAEAGGIRIARIGYCDSLFGTWTIKNLWSGSNESCIYSTTSLKDGIVVGGRYYDGSDYRARIESADDPNELV